MMDIDRDRDRDRDREREPRGYEREPKRYKQDRMKEGAVSPSVMPKLAAPGGHPPPTVGPGLPPLQTHPGYPMPPGPSGPPPPPLGPNAVDPNAPSPARPAPAFLDELDPAAMPPELKKDGQDYWAIFNPKAKRVIDVDILHTFPHASVVCCVQFSADGKYLATGCNRTAQIYELKTGQKTCVLADEAASQTGDLYIRSVCFSPDGKYLATGAEDKLIRIWDIAKRRIVQTFNGHQQEIYSLVFSQTGKLIVSGSGDKTARIWDLVDSSNNKVLAINEPESLTTEAGVTSVAISPDGRLVAAGSLDTVVRIWDVNTGQLLERLRGHRDSVYSVRFTPDGRGLISGSLDKTLKYWDISPVTSAGKRREMVHCTMSFAGHKDYVLSVAVSPDGQWVVSGSKDRSVTFWDSRTATMQCMLQGHKNSVISIDLNQTAQMLATGSGDSQARVCEWHSNITPPAS
ncbi:WD40-repeat-containing domain protein [Schizophyllum fasciatum]